jgi:hypothetical protein
MPTSAYHRVPRRAAFAAAAAAFGALSLHGGAAHAQIDPGVKSFGIYESRPGAAPVLVGEILREDANVTTYAEHWVLYPGYVYPSATNGVVMAILPGLTPYRGIADFFARVPFARGSRYVHVDCLDTTDRPTAAR